MTCEHCGTDSRPGAAWCSLCLRRFDANAVERPVEEPPAVVDVPLARSAMRSPLVRAVILALGGILCGAVLSLGLLFLMFMFSLWGSEVDVASAIIPGAIVAAVGIAAGIWIAVTERRPKLRITQDSLTLTFPGFRRPLVVPRPNVRLVAFDDRRVILFQANERFPVRGDVPQEAFRDPLDRLGLGVPPVVYAATPSPAPIETAGEHEPGWATVGSRPPLVGVPREAAWLYRPDGSALPLFRTAQHEVPNAAVVFHDPMPSPSSWRPVLLERVWARPRIPGMMFRLVTTAPAQWALASWGVVREATADDVLDERLELPKPLRGWRILAFAVFVFLPALIRVVTR